MFRAALNIVIKNKEILNMQLVKFFSITSPRYYFIGEAIQQPCVEFKELVNEGWRNQKIKGRMEEGRTEDE